MRYSLKPWLAGLLLCGSDNQRWKTALFLSTTLMDRRLAVYSDSLIPRGLVGRLEKVLGCRALVVMHDQEGHPSLLTTLSFDQHLTMGLKALLTSYEQAAGLSRVERVVVDREGMAAEFLASTRKRRTHRGDRAANGSVRRSGVVPGGGRVCPDAASIARAR